MVYVLNESDHYAYIAECPKAQVVFFPLELGTCMLVMFQDMKSQENETFQCLSLLQLAHLNSSLLHRVNYSLCLSRHQDRSSHPLRDYGACTYVLGVSNDKCINSNYSPLNVHQADKWQCCRQVTLYSSLPPNWDGTCMLVQLFTLFSLDSSF